MEIASGRPAEWRVAIVTGGSRGIGRAIADRLAQLGYAVVINYLHDQRSADEAVAAILDRRGAAVAVRADVGDELDVERLFEATGQAFGAIDAVVHSVCGDASAAAFAEISLDDFAEMLRASPIAAFIVHRASARHVRNGGAIVNLFSSVGARALPSYGAHAATAAAIEGIVALLARDLRERDLTVNGVLLDLSKPCASGRVADVVAYLLSDVGHAMTGQLVDLDDLRRSVKACTDQ